MASGIPLPPESEVRAQMKRWLDNWERTGPLLEQDRWDRLAALTVEEAQQASLDLLDLWQPDWRGDDGEELLLHQRVFARSRQRRPSR
jgi:hypothetical protein